MEDVGIFDRLLSIAAHWPDLTCVAVGGAVACVLTLALEWFFLPIVEDLALKRRQKGQTFLFCWGLSGSLSTILWRLWDPADPFLVVFATSFIVGPLPFVVYPALARLATKFVPAIGSAWAPPS